MSALCYVPYRAYWSTPFARWQGSFSRLHSLKFAAFVATRALEKRSIDTGALDFAVLGTTIPQQGCFYGLPWVTGLIGADHVGGPTINQACATGARSLQSAALAVASNESACALVIAADRTSNGPHLYYPDPAGIGGSGEHENWVLDNFSKDPYADLAMVETAENVAARYGLDTLRQHALVVERFAQYEAARESGFHERFMDLPFAVPDARFRNTQTVLEGDEGIYPTSTEKLAGLRSVRPGGTVTLGGQTHPADGNTAMVLATREGAKALSSSNEVEISIQGFGLARAERGLMPLAPIPAAQRALKAADVDIDDVAVVTTHNPFAVNDLVFHLETGFALHRMNTHGCSLVWGHPQGPTGLRACIELIEALVLRGGGYGLFTGCAAGDSAMAVVVKVADSRTGTDV